MADQPLAEVFGYPIDNLTAQAEHFRKNKLCPYNNKVPSCTKSKVQDPIGVCSVLSSNSVAITCPIRFRQNWQVVSDAAYHFFPEGTMWTSLPEVRLNDADGQSAGNIDFVLVSFDESGKVLDFGALEIQSVYISGNVSKPFKYYMQDRTSRSDMTYSSTVRPDYLSSSRKRLIPQVIYKGKILNGWKKKIAVVLQDTFFETLPTLPTVSPEQSELIWLVYEMALDPIYNHYTLRLKTTRHTLFQPSLDTITTPRAGDINSFVNLLQVKLDEELEKDEPEDYTFMLNLFDRNDEQ